MARKVFIPNKGGHRYDDALRFGKLVFVTEGTLDRSDTSMMYRKFCEALKDSHKDDYLMITSMNILCVIGAAIFARKHGTLNLLLFSEGHYIERSMDVDILISKDGVL